ncbi:unnamed protein product [Rotaria sp. Silwood2]|nr:unnamed protein product [Rotaria sp. Silwood2]
MYFLASSISQFLTFNFALLTRMLQYGYTIQTVNTVVWFCKIRYYLFYIFVAIPRYLIILASIDRYLASSSDIQRRQWSTPKIAIRLIIGNVLFWCVIYIQIPIFYEIHNGDCSFRKGVYGIFFCIYLLIESGIFPPLMMIIFGLLTLNNIRRSKRTIRPLPIVDIIQLSQFPVMSRKDLLISKMLFNQICLWIILNMFNPCYLLYRTITIYDNKSSLRLTVELFLNNMSYYFIYLEFSLTFFVYTLSSPLFRRANPNVPEKDIYASRPMDIAVLNDDPEMIELLHQYGASLNGLKSMFHLTPLAESFTRGYFDVFKVLLELGAKPILNLDRNIFRSFGTQLFTTGTKGRQHFIQLMYDHGGNIESQFKLHAIRIEPDGIILHQPRLQFSCDPICIADLDPSIFTKWICESRSLKALCRLTIRRYFFNVFNDGFKRLSALKFQYQLNNQLYSYIMFNKKT